MNHPPAYQPSAPPLYDDVLYPDLQKPQPKRMLLSYNLYKKRRRRKK